MTALRLFVGRLSHSLPTRRVPTFSPLPTSNPIAALCKEGRVNEAMHDLHNLHIIVDSSAYVCLLQCCIQKKALHHGKRIHALILNRNYLRFREDVFLHNTLIHMYVKCGSLVDSRGVFDGMIERDSFSWNVMIAAYRKQGLSEESLALFHQMQRNGNGVQPNEFTFSSVLPACADSASLEEGIDIQLNIIKSGFHSDVVVMTALIDMYAKFGIMHKARELFDKMKDRTTVSWNAMIAGYAQTGLVKEAENLFRKMQHKDTISWNTMIAGYAQNCLHEEALGVYEEMQRSDVVLDESTFASVLPTLARSGSLEKGIDIHRKIIRSGFHSNAAVRNVLIDMYAKFGNIQKARVLFEKMQLRDIISWTVMITGYFQIGLLKEAENLFREMQHRSTVSWNAMITGYVHNGHDLEALNCFQKMQMTGFRPDSITFTTVLPACASSASLLEGIDIHRKIVRSGFHSDVVVTNNLIDMYAKFGNIQKASRLFDKMKDRNTFSWNALIAGYAQNGLHQEALNVFEEMQRSGVVPNEFTFSSVVALFASSASLEECVGIHRKIIKNGFHCDVVIVNALIDMYAKFGNIQKACVLFAKTIDRNMFSWNTMIAGYAQNGLLKDAEFLFKEMHHRDTISWNSLIAGFAQNGFLDEAVKLFNEIPQRDTISWNAMITGYAMHGFAKEAINLFEEMERLGLNPDHVTFISVLSACSHSALVKEGFQYFKSMKDCYRITPTMEHYTCMVDLLGRAGRLDEAKDFINSMPIKHNAAAWTCLLGACRIHNNFKLAEVVAEHLLELDPQNSAPYVLLSNSYAVSGRWNQIESIRKMMKDRGIQKLPGCSWIVVNK